jgi:hypothetical protein
LPAEKDQCCSEGSCSRSPMEPPFRHVAVIGPGAIGLVFAVRLACLKGPRDARRLPPDRPSADARPIVLHTHRRPSPRFPSASFPRPPDLAILVTKPRPRTAANRQTLVGHAPSWRFRTAWRFDNGRNIARRPSTPDDLPAAYPRPKRVCHVPTTRPTSLLHRGPMPQSCAGRFSTRRTPSRSSRHSRHLSNALERRDNPAALRVRPTARPPRVLAAPCEHRLEAAAPAAGPVVHRLARRLRRSRQRRQPGAMLQDLERPPTRSPT